MSVFNTNTGKTDFSWVTAPRTAAGREAGPAGGVGRSARPSGPASHGKGAARGWRARPVSALTRRLADDRESLSPCFSHSSTRGAERGRRTFQYLLRAIGSHDLGSRPGKSKCEPRGASVREAHRNHSPEVRPGAADAHRRDFSRETTLCASEAFRLVKSSPPRQSRIHPLLKSTVMALTHTTKHLHSNSQIAV